MLGLNLSALKAQLDGPYDGLSWSSRTGIIDAVDPEGPAFGHLQVGDRITAVNHRPFPDVTSSYREAGQIILFSIERQGILQEISLRLAAPSRRELIQRQMLALVAVAFWGVGMLVFAYQIESIQSRLFFLVCLLVSGVLSMGSVADLNASLQSRLYGIFLWWLPATLYQFHLYFPTTNPNRTLHRLIPFFYLIAGAASIPYVVLNVSDLYQGFLFNFFFFFRRLWLGAGLVGSVALLFQSQRAQKSNEARKRIGLVVLGGVMAIVPFLSFSLLPDVLFGEKVIDYEYGFLFLLAIPIFYGYAILRYRLIPLARYVSWMVASMVAVLLLACLYWILKILLLRLPLGLWNELVGVLALAFLLSKAWEPLQKAVNSLLYGGWTDHRTAATRVSQIGFHTSDAQSLRQNFLEELQNAMQLECACLFLKSRDGSGSSVQWVCGSSCPFHTENPLIQAPTHEELALTTALQNQTTPVPAEALRSRLDEVTVTILEGRILKCQKASYWLPFNSPLHTQGALIVGNKRGGAELTGRDLETLEVITRQAIGAIENAQLVFELNQRNQEMVQLHNRSIRARDEERKNLARELHDDVIQSLAAINLGVGNIQRQADALTAAALKETQGNLRKVVADLRNICTDLRPPVLDSLGLAVAVRARVRDFEEKNPTQVSFQFEGNEDFEVSDEIGACILRILQEGLLNIAKHSEAKQANVLLRLSSDQLELKIADDGKGFALPDRLGTFLQNGHFGLVGLQEQVEMHNGKLDIQSAPGKGCRILVTIPLL